MTKNNIFEWVEQVGKELDSVLGNTFESDLFKNLKNLKEEFQFDRFEINSTDKKVYLNFNIDLNLIRVEIFYKSNGLIISEFVSDKAEVII